MVEALLNHTSGAAKRGMAGTYNRFYRDQKRAALARWAEHIGKLPGRIPRTSLRSGAADGEGKHGTVSRRAGGCRYA